MKTRTRSEDDDILRYSSTPHSSLIRHSRLLECLPDGIRLVKEDGLCSYLQPPTSTFSHPQPSSRVGLWTEFVCTGGFCSSYLGGRLPPSHPTPLERSKDSHFIHQVSSITIFSWAQASLRLMHAHPICSTC